MYTATILGNLWLGGLASTSVSVVADTVADAKNQVEWWSDFAGVLDYELVQTTQCPCCHANTVETIVRPWTTPHPELEE